METPVVSCAAGGQGELVDDSVGRLIPLGQSADTEGTRTVEDSEAQAYADALREVIGSEAYGGDVPRVPRAHSRRIHSGRYEPHTGRHPRGSVRGGRAVRAARARRRACPGTGSVRPVTSNSTLITRRTEERLRGMGAALAGGCAAQAELERIRAMRSYRLAEHYRSWMSRPALRKLRGWLRKG